MVEIISILETYKYIGDYKYSMLRVDQIRLMI